MRAPSHQRLSVDDLCAKHGNEEAHATHVAALARQLFDATHRWVGAPAGDWPLLEAAGRLHDLGYGTDPRRHARAGRAIIRRQGIRGFAAAERDDIAAAVALHPDGLGSDDAETALRGLADIRRARRLAAYLRIADGLDHGHLQDAAIIRVTKTGRTICVRISSGYGRANLEAAQRKSDQWHAVFPCDIRLKAVAGRALRARLPRSSEMPPGEAARRLLWTHYGALRANVAAVAEAGNSAALHDLRVAIRRMRSVLRVFRDALAPTGGARIDRDLQKLNAALGEARDLDVWIDYLVRNALKARLRGHPRWANFVGHQRELRRLQQITVRRHLRGASFKALEHRIGHLLRVELPRATAAAAPPDAEAGWERRLLAKFLRRALKLRGQRHSHSPAELHQLRMALRRVRHIGEFFGSRLAAPAGELMKRVQAVERMLGRMRDVDLAIARIQLEGPAPPRLLVGKLERRRLHNRIDLRRAWRRLEKRRFRRLMRRPPAS